MARRTYTEFVKKPLGLPPVTRQVAAWTPRCAESNPKLSGPPRDRRPKHVGGNPFRVTPPELDLGVVS